MVGMGWMMRGMRGMQKIGRYEVIEKIGEIELCQSIYQYPFSTSPLNIY
jgi:hypothetical protein